MKLSRNKISKLIKKKKHSRSKVHKKRDVHTVVFSKSKDYDKPITRKKGGWKGYHGRSCKRTMKRVYRGGDNTNKANPQKDAEKQAKSVKIPAATKTQADSTADKAEAEVCAVLPEDPPYNSWEEVDAALNNFTLKCEYNLLNKRDYLQKILNKVPRKNDVNNVRQKLKKMMDNENMLKSQYWFKWISDFIRTTVPYNVYNECSINLKNITVGMDNIKSDKKAIEGITNIIQLYNNCYVGVGESGLQLLWKNKTVTYLNNVVLAKGKSLLQGDKYNNVINYARELRDALIISTYDPDRVKVLVENLGAYVTELEQNDKTKVGDKSESGKSATPAASSASAKINEETKDNNTTCSTLPTKGTYEEILQEIRKFNLESGCGISKQSVQQFLENLQKKINDSSGVSEKDEPMAKKVEEEFKRLRSINDPAFTFSEWLKSFVLAITPSTLSDDVKKKCKDDIDIVNVNFDSFEEFAKSVASMDTIFGTCYKPEKGEISRPVTEWKEKYKGIITRYNKLLETSEVFKNNTGKLSNITSILNELENSSSFKSVNSTESDDIEKILIKLKDAIKAYSPPPPTLPKEGTAVQTGSISANDLQTMQQKSAEALKSAQDHHAKVQDLVKANPLATLTADTYNFDECAANMSMAKKEIIGTNPEYRKAQPKCKPFIDKTMTERKQWVDGMKKAVTLKKPSEKCAAFTASESKKIDDYAAKCAKQENQVVVNISEAPINDTHKRMNITVFAPNKSEVVLQDYAHSTYEQTMHNFEDLKMDGELDLSGLTNAASAAKDAVKKAASATITSAKKAVTKAKEVVSGTGTTPDAPATPIAPATPATTPATPDAPATPAGPGIIGKIKNYLRKGQLKEMRENMSNLQDVSDQLSDDMTPNQVKQQENMVEEINSLIDKLTQKQPASVSQVGGDQGAVDGAQVLYDEAEKKADSMYNSTNPDDLKNYPQAVVDKETTARALSHATLRHANQVNSDNTSHLQQKVDAANQHMVAAETHLTAAKQRLTIANANLNEKTDEFNTTQERNKNATNEELNEGAGDDYKNANNSKILAEEEQMKAEAIVKAAGETKEESEISHTRLQNELNTEQAKREASNINDNAKHIYDKSSNFDDKLEANNLAKEHTQKFLNAAKVHLDTASEDKKEEAEKNLSLAKNMHSEATGKNSELLQSKALDNIGKSDFINKEKLEESVGNAVAANKEHINATYDNEKSSSADKLKADENHASFLKKVINTDKGKSLGFDDEMNEAQKNVKDAKAVAVAEKEHEKTKIALVTAKAKLENVKVSSDSTKNIVDTAEARNKFDNALTEHTDATERLNEAQEKRGCGDESAGEDCKKKLQDDKNKRAKEVNELSKSESDDGKNLLDVANTKVSQMQVTKRQKDIEDLLDTYEIILKKLRKMYGGPGAKKGDIMVSQSVLDNMNALLVKMVTQQEIIVKALGKITPENEIFTNQSEVVSGFMFKVIKEYVERNVSVSETVKKEDMENINEQLKIYIKKIEKDVLSKDARNYTKDVISSARASNEPIKSVNNRVNVWRDIVKYIRKDVLKLNPIEEMDILAQDLSNLLAKIKDTPLKDDDQTNIVEIIKEIIQIIDKESTLSKYWNAVWLFISKIPLIQIDTNEDIEAENKENENKEKMKYFTSLSGDDKEPDGYKETVEEFESKLKVIKEKIEKLDIEEDSSGPQKVEITGTDATTINKILSKIQEQANKLSKNVNENYQNDIVVKLEKVKEIEANYNFKGSNNNKDLTNLLTDLNTKDTNKLFDSKTIPVEKRELETYNVSIENIITTWKKALGAIEEIITKNKSQTGGRKRHYRKSKKRKSKSKSSGIKLTRKSSKK